MIQKKSIVLFVKEIEPLNKALQIRTNIIENLIREWIYGIRLIMNWIIIVKLPVKPRIFFKNKL